MVDEACCCVRTASPARNLLQVPNMTTTTTVGRQDAKGPDEQHSTKINSRWSMTVAAAVPAFESKWRHTLSESSRGRPNTSLVNVPMVGRGEPERVGHEAKNGLRQTHIFEDRFFWNELVARVHGVVSFFANCDWAARMASTATGILRPRGTASGAVHEHWSRNAPNTGCVL
jgi:hypothetical protein